MTDAVKKEKKVMTPERLEQLARARAKALEIRKAGAAIKAEHKELAEAALNEKIEEVRQVKMKLMKAENFQPTPKDEIENKIIKDKLVENPVTQEYVPEYSPRVEVQPPVLSKSQSQSDSESDFESIPRPIKPIKPVTAEGLATASRKSKKPIKTKIVIEQSSDDEDEFHPHEHVIFVKRKSKNDSKAKVVPVTIPAATPAPNVSPVRGNRNEIPLQSHPQQALRQLPTYPMGNTMDDFVNAGFANYRKYY